jgi:hypothetical protein
MPGKYINPVLLTRSNQHLFCDRGAPAATPRAYLADPVGNSVRRDVEIRPTARHLREERDRPDPPIHASPETLTRVNAFADECRRRGVFVAGDPLLPKETATTISIRDGQILITDGPFAETHEHLGGYYVWTAATSTKPSNWPRCARWPNRA